MSDGKQLLPIAVVAGMLDVSTKTIRRMVAAKLFPRAVRMVRGRPRWLRSDVETYLNAIRLGILIDGREEAEGIEPDRPVKSK